MLDIKEFHARNVKFVKELYEKNTDADYDLIPFMAALMDINGETKMVMHAIADGPPLDTAHAIIHTPYVLKDLAAPGAPAHAAADFVMITFVSPIWIKDPDAPSVRTGEGVTLVSETRSERICTMLDCVRDPLPTLTERAYDVMPTEYSSRLPLLFDPNHTEH